MSIDPFDKITLLDAMIRLGYRGAHHDDGWRGHVSLATANAERKAMRLHQAVAENGFSYRAMVTCGTLPHLTAFLGPYA